MAAWALLLAGFAAPGSAAEPSPLPQATSILLICPTPEETRVTPAPAGAPVPGGCGVMPAPVPVEAIRWAGWLARMPAPERSVTVEGAGLGPAFRPGFAKPVEPDAKPPRPAPLPIGEPLLQGLSVKPFGVEERVSIERGGEGVALACRPGERPAGLVLDPGDRRLPEGANLVLAWEAQGDDGFSGGAAAPEAEPRRTTPVGSGEASLRLPVEQAAGPIRFVVACPPGGGKLTISGLKLRPAAPGVVESRGAWAWKPAFWRDEPERLIGRAREAGIDRLFVSVDIADGAVRDAQKFAAFVALARRRGIDVAVVEGDPGMATEAGREGALARLKALAAYQASASPEARLAGLQYDIEPYLLPAYRSDPVGVLRDWAATVEALKAASPLDLDMVVPFWLRDAPGAEATILPALKRTASAITIMAYRTRDDAVQAVAEPLLAWSAEAGVPVRVAIEGGPLDDEETRVYRPAPQGELWLLPRGEGAVVLLLDRARANPAGLAFALERRIEAPASRVSFLGDEARLLASARRLGDALAAWPSFIGVALHGLLE